MRKFLCLFLLVSCAGVGRAQMNSHVDPRFELTGIAFRLAGAQEYARCDVHAYAEDIDTYFSPYADHPLMAFIRQIRNDYSIGYDAVSTSTDRLVIEDGHVKLGAGYEIADITAVEPRWTETVFQRYVTLLDDFYRESAFQHFYDDHREMYDYAEKQLDSLLTKVDPQWFVRFYGREFGEPEVFICMCNGPSNYALTETGRRSGYGIVVGCGRDEQGQPAFGSSFLPIILHELAHNYSNPVFLDYWPMMEHAANEIWPYVADKMAKGAYGSAWTMTGEWFNELCVLMAFREMQPEWLNSLTVYDEYRGYIWMGHAVALMDEFYADRERYPHIGDFMPRIVEFYSRTASEIGAILEAFRQRAPYVVEVFPAVGSSVSADALPAEIVVRFSQPMQGGYGGTVLERANVIVMPFDGVCFWRDEYTLVYPVKQTAFEKGKTYGFLLYGWAFNSAKLYPMADDYPIMFTVE